MKLIFLDVDGVLNSEDYIVSEHDRLGHEKYVDTYLRQGGIPFDPKCLKILFYILDTTDALICVSSTWRLSKDEIEGTIRFSLSCFNTEEEILETIKVLKSSVEDLRFIIKKGRK